MGSQAYGWGAGMQSLGSSLLQVGTMYAMLNDDDIEQEDVLTEAEKLEAKRKKDAEVVEDDASIQTMYGDLESDSQEVSGFGSDAYGGLLEKHKGEIGSVQGMTPNNPMSQIDLNNYDVNQAYLEMAEDPFWGSMIKSGAVKPTIRVRQ